MDFKKVLAIVDKNVNQEQLLKDLGAEFILPFVKAMLENVDLIPGTQIDNNVIKDVLAYLEKKILGQ